jgi:hypothetical protein
MKVIGDANSEKLKRSPMPSPRPAHGRAVKLLNSIQSNDGPVRLRFTAEDRPTFLKCWGLW